MDANTRKLERIFDQTITYQIPLFQRPYVWKKDDNWEPLWEDIQTLLDKHLRGAKVHAHFLGAVVLEQLPNPTGSIESRQVIDGQQRFTTLQLFLMAARDLAGFHRTNKYVERFTDLVANRRSRIDHDDEVFKVWPTNSNRAAFRLVHEAGSPEKINEALKRSRDVDEHANNIIGAYRFFHTQLADWFKGRLDDDADAELLSKKTVDDRFDSLWHVVKECLQVVVIDLDKEDETQVIFETLNARGEDLLPADLIKNFLFRRAAADNEDVERLYDNHWHQFETSWWREEVKQGRIKRPRVDVFISHYLTMMMREEVKASHLFNAFKAFVMRPEEIDGSLLVVPKTAADHIAQLSRYAEVFKALFAPNHHARLQTFLLRLEAVDTTTVFPFLLYAYAELVPHATSEFDAILVLVESYLMRRMICHLTGKHYNRYFVDLIRTIDRNGKLSAAAVSEHMAKSGADSIRYPDDQSVSTALAESPLYGRLAQAKVRAILEALDAHAYASKSEAQALPPDLTIEHVMPQAWAAHWPLGKDDVLDPVTGAPDPIREQKARQRRERLINTLGNLSLITGSLNPSLSNAAWADKRRELLKFSRLNLTRYFHEAEADDWNEAAIERRTAYLSEQVIQIWPGLVQAGAETLPRHPASAAPALASASQNDYLAVPLAAGADRLQACPDSGDPPFVPALPGYTGSAPSAFAWRVIHMLKDHGFKVDVTTQGPNSQRKTLHISWRNVRIGQMSAGLWGRKRPYACLYRFWKDTAPFSIAKAPHGFDKQVFATEHGCDPDLLHVNSDYSGSYLYVQDEATSLHLMQEWARKIDAAFGAGGSPIN
ncbi:DUF262 domain-containing HNH endonuclease family protein [Massilia sp. IC2-278]|uniref:DUF262 domain-containing protein n=1 Tax=Massilia sp. IC2-278 TaxID=2887200 RepID=UPI001E653C13|nr:DUF262 domain-containing protein [Massilia sp. IC2-278]MCC2962958.1 DUF262 domain-containing HNH endonuclease family protein [Massilia sp. IC2-278]